MSAKKKQLPIQTSFSFQAPPPDRESEVRRISDSKQDKTQQKTVKMLSIVPDISIPSDPLEKAMEVLLNARFKIAGVFAVNQPALIPGQEEFPKIPDDSAEAIIREASKNLDDDENVGFRISEIEVGGGKKETVVKIIPQPNSSENAWDKLEG